MFIYCPNIWDLFNFFIMHFSHQLFKHLLYMWWNSIDLEKEGNNVEQDKLATEQMLLWFCLQETPRAVRAEAGFPGAEGRGKGTLVFHRVQNFSLTRWGIQAMVGSDGYTTLWTHAMLLSSTLKMMKINFTLRVFYQIRKSKGQVTKEWIRNAGDYWQA